MDQIVMKGLVFYGYHGALPEEERLGQRFAIDIELGLHLAAAGASDDLGDTVNYAEVYQLVKRQTEECRYRLIEKLAGEINREILSAFPRVQQVRTTVHKPSAPVPGALEDIFVSLERRRP